MTSHDDSYDWSALIRDHPLFGEISGKHIKILLDPGNSTPRSFDRDYVIFRAGEIGNSFYLIGEGSVNVELSSEESSSTTRFPVFTAATSIYWMKRHSRIASSNSLVSPGNC
jgi:hypothetical protein